MVETTLLARDPTDPAWTNVHINDVCFITLFTRAASSRGYHCDGWRPHVARLGSLRLSWMFWVDRGVPYGIGDRPDDTLLAEMGLRHHSPGHDASAPDLIVLSSGLWDVQDGSAATYARSVPRLVALLRTHYPNTTLIWLSPLPTMPTEHTFRTAHRLAEHVAVGLAAPLKKLGVSLLNLLPVFSPIPSVDGRHYEVRYYADAFSIVLNEWARLARFDANELIPEVTCVVRHANRSTSQR